LRANKNAEMTNRKVQLVMIASLLSLSLSLSLFLFLTSADLISKVKFFGLEIDFN